MWTKNWIHLSKVIHNPRRILEESAGSWQLGRITVYSLQLQHHIKKPASFCDKTLRSDKAQIELFDGNSSKYDWGKDISYNVKNTIQQLQWRKYDFL